MKYHVVIDTIGFHDVIHRQPYYMRTSPLSISIKWLCGVDNRMQLMMEQLILSKQERFGRSSEKLTDHGPICFMEVDGEIIPFNEAEAVSDLDAPEPNDLEQPKAKGKKITGKKEEDLSGLTTHMIPHYMTGQELIREFGENGWKQLPDVVTKRYKFVPAKVEVEEHHIGVYASKKMAI